MEYSKLFKERRVRFSFSRQFPKLNKCLQVTQCKTSCKIANDRTLMSDMFKHLKSHIFECKCKPQDLHIEFTYTYKVHAI